MKIVRLLCSGGMSTSLLASKMQKIADDEGYEVEITAHSVNHPKRDAGDADLVLLGPQVGFQRANIEKELPDKLIEVIDMRAYGTMNAQAVLDQVKSKLD